MDLDTTIRTVIANCPGIKAQFLIANVKKSAGGNCSRSTIYDHIESLIIKNEIFRENGRYWLEPPAGAARRVQKKHTKEIISGLSALAEGGRYTISGDIPPDPTKVEIALQHLKIGYSDVFSLKETERIVFLDRLRQLIKLLKLGDEKLKGYCNECERRLPRKLTGRKKQRQQS